MWRRFRPPLVLVAIALFALLVMLAVLQYRWLGQISDAERAQRRATLATGAVEFAQDFDREVTRAYLLFQADGPFSTPASDDELAERFAARHDRWQATARFPRLLKEFYAYSEGDTKRPTQLRRFDPATRLLQPAEWPDALKNWRDQLSTASWKDTGPSGGNALFIRRMPPPIWESAPAVVVPAPVIFFGDQKPGSRVSATTAYTLLLVDREYVTRELLPSLAERHFGHPAQQGVGPAGLDFKVAVVRKAPSGGVLFQSTPSYTPAIDADGDASADLFQVRTQDFLSLAAEVRRFTSFVSPQHGPPATTGTARFAITEMSEARPLSIVIQKDTHVSSGAPEAAAAATTRTETRLSASSLPQWRLVVTHPSGSLEASVNSQRRRNLLISPSVLGLLGASMGLLVLATRRAQRLATQQMEFVAAVSHALRTPLAVIRSAADNLADGVVNDETRIRRYGELMRNEGRRLTEMVEQILEFAGIQSGQRGFALRPVGIRSLLQDIVAASSGLIEDAGLSVTSAIPDDLPDVLGDEAALRRVFQNLIDNAIKYGAAGGAIAVTAERSGPQVSVTVADRGIGIDAADQAKIFEPFYRAAAVVAAQMQGAGLGLSLVQRIVQAHGGRVTVKSAPGEGSAFTVTLPSAGERAAVAPASADASPGVQAVRSS
jgi:signal transduction histidine kinase